MHNFTINWNQITTPNGGFHFYDQSKEIYVQNKTAQRVLAWEELLFASRGLAGAYAI